MRDRLQSENCISGSEVHWEATTPALGATAPTGGYCFLGASLLRATAPTRGYCFLGATLLGATAPTRGYCFLGALVGATAWRTLSDIVGMSLKPLEA